MLVIPILRRPSAYYFPKHTIIMKLEAKVAVITGGNSGIGLAITDRF
jgi:hypothetical protein